MTYTKQTWVDGVSGGTPISATRLNHLEDGVLAAVSDALLVALVSPPFTGTPTINGVTAETTTGAQARATVAQAAAATDATAKTTAVLAPDLDGGTAASGVTSGFLAISSSIADGTVALSKFAADVPLKVFNDSVYVFAILDSLGRAALTIGLDGTVRGKIVLNAGAVTAAMLASDVPLLTPGAVTVAMLAADVPVPQAINIAYGYAKVSLDAAGKIGEDAIGADGRVPQWILDRWATRMSVAAAVVPPDPTAIVLPSQLHLISGVESKLVHARYIESLALDHHVKVEAAGNGSRLGDQWKVTPTAAATYTSTISVLDRAYATVTSKTIAVTQHSAAAIAAVPVRHLAIGDSITRNGAYAGYAATQVGGVTVGSRSYNNGVLNVEGRGGWALTNYMTQIGSLLAGDSPFLFPTTIAGPNFWGNTEFWRKVGYVSMATLPTSGYDFDGFQRMARGWTTAGALQFNSTGYPVSPAEGDVVVDPTKTAGSIYQQYVSGAWVTMSPQPTIGFSFAKYMARYAAAYAGGPPTSISIMLSTNDFFTAATAGSLAAFATSLDVVTASIRAWSSMVPIIIMLPMVGGPASYWGTTTTVHKFEFDARMRTAAASLITKYDNATSRTNNILLCPFTGAVDDVNIPDIVHPVDAGHLQMAPWLAGAIAQAMGV